MSFDRRFTGDLEENRKSLFFFSIPFLFPFLLTLPTKLFDFLQVRESFLSLYYSSCHVSPFPWPMCHMETYSRWHSPHYMALMSCVFLPWVPCGSPWSCHVTPPHVSPDTQCLEKRENSTISEINESHLGN